MSSNKSYYYRTDYVFMNALRQCLGLAPLLNNRHTRATGPRITVFDAWPRYSGNSKAISVTPDSKVKKVSLG